MNFSFNAPVQVYLWALPAVNLGPTQAYFDKTWKPDYIEKVK
jgi:hypothetical protein